MEFPQQNNSAQNDVEYLDSFPPGYRFCPTEVELVLCYLKKKVDGAILPRNKIIDVDIYNYNPHWLAERYRPCGEKVWYFFSPRNRKYKNGSRPNRAAGDGYWKATGADKHVYYYGQNVGLKKTLVFHIGKPSVAEKTNWIMHEFRIPDAPAPQRQHVNDMKLDHWVLCKIYHKNAKSAVLRLTNGPNEEQVPNQGNEEAEAEEMVMENTNNTIIDGAYIGHSHVQDNNVFPLSSYPPQQQPHQYQSSIVPYSNPIFESYDANIVDDYSALNDYPDYQMGEIRSLDHKFDAVDDWIIWNDHPKGEGVSRF